MEGGHTTIRVIDPIIVFYSGDRHEVIPYRDNGYDFQSALKKGSRFRGFIASQTKRSTDEEIRAKAASVFVEAVKAKIVRTSFRSGEGREYLLEKRGRKCAYCNEEDTRLEIDHIVAKAKGGSNGVSNLTIVCRDCNLEKGSKPLQEFLKNKPLLCSKILTKAKVPLNNAAAVNSTRAALARSLNSFNLPYSCSSGGQTKFNRVNQNYEKDHWIDAACVGQTGASVHIPTRLSPLIIKATGRGSRQCCLPDKYGFPRTSAKAQKTVHGFKTGDLVKAIVPKGVKTGTHFGRVAVRSSGSFCINTQSGKIDGISYKHCNNLQRSDGYGYLLTKPKKEQRFLPVLKDEVSALSRV